MDNQRKRRAFFSVWHKKWKGKDIVEIAGALVEQGWEIEASGGTCKHLRAGGLTCLDIAERVGEPILGHRVVTLSREFMAGLLATDSEADQAELAKHGIPRIDLVVVGFYPLREAIVAEGATLATVLEATDIGGPTMARAAAKGNRVVCVDPDDYGALLADIVEGRLDDPERIRARAAKAQAWAAEYALLSARFESGGVYEGVVGEEVRKLSYGENPHQQNSRQYRLLHVSGNPLAPHRFTQVAGSVPSYCGIKSLDKGLRTMAAIAAVFARNGIDAPFIAVGTKHNNPCGAAVGATPDEVIQRMITGDTRAIFGGTILCNFPIGKAEAKLLRYYASQGKRPLDVVVAPAFLEDAGEDLERKDNRCRLFENPAMAEISPAAYTQTRECSPIEDGFVSQPRSGFVLDFAHPLLEVVGPPLTDGQKRDLALAWAVGSTSVSNTITLAKGGMIIGNGVGGQDRVGVAELAIRKAHGGGHTVSDFPSADGERASAYGDSFKPFPDGAEVLTKAGVGAVFCSKGGSKFPEIVAHFKEKDGVTLATLPDEVCRGFYGH